MEQPEDDISDDEHDGKCEEVSEDLQNSGDAKNVDDELWVLLWNIQKKYAGLLLGPAEGFGRLLKLLYHLSTNKKAFYTFCNCLFCLGITSKHSNFKNLIEPKKSQIINLNMKEGEFSRISKKKYI